MKADLYQLAKHIAKLNPVDIAGADHVDVFDSTVKPFHGVTQWMEAPRHTAYEYYFEVHGHSCRLCFMLGEQDIHRRDFMPYLCIAVGTVGNVTWYRRDASTELADRLWPACCPDVLDEPTSKLLADEIRALILDSDLSVNP